MMDFMEEDMKFTLWTHWNWSRPTTLKLGLKV